MKKIYNLLIIAALLAVSCEKSVVESPTVETEPEQEIVYPEIQVALSVDTKTTISDNGDSFSIAFAVDDDIAVFNGEKDEDTHLPCRYRCTRIEGGVAYFSYNPTSDDERAIVPDTELAEIVAIYPFRETTTSEFEGHGAGTVKFRFVNSHESSSKSFAKTSLPLVASAASGSPLTFHHTLGMLQLNLQGSDCAVKQIVVESDQKIAGNGSVSYASATPTLDIFEDAYSATTSFYKATYAFGGDDGIALTSEGTPFYIGLPEGTHNLNLIITDADGNSMTISAPSVPISRGVVLPTTIPYTADPLTNVTNLSAFGHFANCYVVSKAGNYCFNARKPDGTLVSGASATWVWASSSVFSGGATESILNENLIDNISLSNGKIYFSTPKEMSTSNCGNVVVAVLDGSKNIQYTWHLWLTPSPSLIEVAELTIMDRNLGAGAAGYTNQNSYGNFYQWGRKDPILGGMAPSKNNAGSEDSAFSGGVSQYYIINTAAEITDLPSAWQSAPASGFGTTVEAGAQHPLTMAKSTAVPGYDSSDKTTPWCDRQNGNSNPCPYGYRVLSDAQFAALVATGVAQSVSGDYGKVMLGSLLNVPRAGFRRGNGGKYTNSALDASGSCYGRYYTDNVNSSTASQGDYYQFIWGYNTETSKYTFSSTQTYSGSIDAYNACSVRCVKE